MFKISFSNPGKYLDIGTVEGNLVFAKIIIRARNAKIIDILQPLFCIHDLICIWLIFPLSSLLTSFSRFTIFTHWLKTSLHERKRLSFYFRKGFNINSRKVWSAKRVGVVGIQKCGQKWTKNKDFQDFGTTPYFFGIVLLNPYGFVECISSILYFSPMCIDLILSHLMGGNWRAGYSRKTLHLT